MRSLMFAFKVPFQVRAISGVVKSENVDYFAYLGSSNMSEYNNPVDIMILRVVIKVFESGEREGK